MNLTEDVSLAKRFRVSWMNFRGSMSVSDMLTQEEATAMSFQKRSDSSILYCHITERIGDDKWRLVRFRA